MFGSIFNSVDNALSIVSNVVSGEDVSRYQVTKLISDGVSIALIASAFGVAESVIREVINDE